jgi:chromosomal replication initiation ATPase DnaA
MKKHEWREKNEEGETRLVTATRHAGKWKLRSRLKSEPDWTEFPAIEFDDLETLHEIISKKYQRSRVPHEHVLEIEALMAAAKPPRQ